MRTALEEKLTLALAQRAAAVPPGSGQRLRAVDYHPRRHRLGVPAAVGAGAAASAATVGTVLAVVLGGATPAYAGWSAAPTATSAPSSAAPDCVGALTSAQVGPSRTSSTGTWQTLLTDVRGPFTISLLQNGNSYASCFTSPSFTEVNQITAASGSGGAQSGSLSVRGQSAAGSGSPSQG
ncbi:MAG TPA: hypothetical protein VHS57_06460, partial [Acidimicrobiales bacterium]|nr:hypothetical protein [Acidimicrobiales bacterium]